MLGSFFGLKGGRAHVGQLVLVSDVITDGSFLVHHFISQALKDGHHTILVSLTQSLLHYSSVCSKLGLNIHKKREEGSFVFVDGLSSLLSRVFTPIVQDSVDAIPQISPLLESEQRSRERLLLSLGNDCSLHGVFKTLQHLVTEAGGQDKPVCLIVDGLSVLLNVGVALDDIVVLVQMCTHLLTSSHGPCQGEGYLVVMVHCEEEGEEGGYRQPEQLLHTHLLHLCHLQLQARGLTTGYSRDIHGQICVKWRDPACSGLELPPQQTAQYKLTDKSIQIFARGMSTAVL